MVIQMTKIYFSDLVDLHLQLLKMLRSSKGEMVSYYVNGTFGPPLKGQGLVPKGTNPVIRGRELSAPSP